MVRYKLPSDVDNVNTVAGRAYSRFYPIDVYALAPSLRTRESQLVRSFLESQKRWIALLIITGLGIILHVLTDPASYMVSAYVGGAAVAAEILLDLGLAWRRTKKMPEELGEEGTETYYRVLMAQMLGCAYVNVRGIMFRV